MITKHTANRIYHRHRKELAALGAIIARKDEITAPALIQELQARGENCSTTRAVEALKAATLLGLINPER